MFRSLSLLALAAGVLACDADTTQALPVDEAPPAIGYDNFVIGDMLGGIPTNVSWEDASLVPGTTARLFMSPNGAGAGPCPPVLAGDCAGLTMPIRQVATGIVEPGYSITGASGATYTVENHVIIPITPPAALGFGVTFGMQIAAPDGAGGWVLSPAANKTSGFGICPLIFAPTCGIDYGTSALGWDNACVTQSVGMVVVSDEGDCP